MRTSGLLLIFLSALLVHESRMADLDDQEYYPAQTKKPPLDCYSGFLEICQVPALALKCGKQKECGSLEVSMLSMGDPDVDSSVAIEGVDGQP